MQVKLKFLLYSSNFFFQRKKIESYDINKLNSRKIVIIKKMRIIRNDIKNDNIHTFPITIVSDICREPLLVCRFPAICTGLAVKLLLTETRSIGSFLLKLLSKSLLLAKEEVPNALLFPKLVSVSNLVSPLVTKLLFVWALTKDAWRLAKLAFWLKLEANSLVNDELRRDVVVKLAPSPLARLAWRAAALLLVKAEAGIKK